MSRQIQPLPAVAEYFGTNEIPVIAQEFHFPGKGWVRTNYKKRVSRSWLRKLKSEGVTVVALDLNGRVADFTLRELLA